MAKMEDSDWEWGELIVPAIAVLVLIALALLAAFGTGADR
jgi:hypothetical protein